jgi:general secretion pathway protein D
VTPSNARNLSHPAAAEHRRASRLHTRGWLALALMLGVACTTPAPNQSQALIDQGSYREGLQQLEQAMRERPGDVELRIQYMRGRDTAIARLLAQAGAEFGAGRWDAAAATLAQVQGIDAVNPRAAAGLAAIDTARRHAVLGADAKARLAAGDALSAELMVKSILAENPSDAAAREIDRDLRERERRRALAVPVLKSKLQNPVTLEFREAALRNVMEAMARSAGINFIIDRDVRADLRVTIFARNVLIEDALDLIVQNHQLEKKILNENTILIYPNTPQKLREHQELLMRTFHLGNADPKQTLNLLRTMLKTKDLFIDERSNMIVMRDTPDAIRAAERLIANQDTAEPEVVLELEILEVSRSKVRDLGLTLPTAFSGPSGSIADINVLNRHTIGANNGYGLRLLRTDGDTKTLANPRVRVRNKEKARVHVGDRVPVISSTIVGTTSTGSSGSAPVTTEQIQYIDVGIKIEAEPTIHADDTVAIKINLDVSSLGTQTKTNAGTTAYEVGTRNASTVLRLRDGETQALMGLIRDEDSQSGEGLPFIGEVPGLDKLFGTKRTERRSRELVLLITPQLVRGFERGDASLAEFWSGTEAAVRTRTPFVRDAVADDARGSGAPGSAPTLVIGGTGAGPVGGGALPGGAGASVAAAVPARAAPLVLSWVGPAAAVKVGDEFDVELKARTEGPLKGVTAQLRFDPALIEVLSVSDGGFFARVGDAAVFTPRIDANAGIVFATLGAQGSESTPGDAVLLRLRVKLRKAGAAAAFQIGSMIGFDASNRRVAVEGFAPLEVKALP